jgi:DNA invertase Pin-like site-specific DNA recombinase
MADLVGLVLGATRPTDVTKSVVEAVPVPVRGLIAGGALAHESGENQFMKVAAICGAEVDHRVAIAAVDRLEHLALEPSSDRTPLRHADDDAGKGSDTAEIGDVVSALAAPYRAPDLVHVRKSWWGSEKGGGAHTGNRPGIASLFLRKNAGLQVRLDLYSEGNSGVCPRSRNEGASVAREKTKRAALYVRVSTDEQTVANQLAELRRALEFERWTEVAVYSDEGISGTKGRDERPGLDQLLEDAKRRKFDVIMVWAIDRLGRSLRGLLDAVEFIHKCKVDLYLMRERIDTTNETGKLLFSILGSLAEFERATIQKRAEAGMKRVRTELVTKGSFVARKSGKVRTRFGRPDYVDKKKVEAARAKLATGAGILKVAKLVGLGTGTVHKIAREMRGAAS